MVDTNIAAMKLTELSRRIERARALCPTSAEELTGDTLDLVSFNLFVAVQTCLDVATYLIAEKSWEPAATAREAFERLEERRVISKETVQSLRRAVGLRNIVAHGYSGVEPAMIHAAAQTGLPDLERFASEVSVWLGSES